MHIEDFLCSIFGNWDTLRCTRPGSLTLASGFHNHALSDEFECQGVTNMYVVCPTLSFIVWNVFPWRTFPFCSCELRTFARQKPQRQSPPVLFFKLRFRKVEQSWEIPEKSFFFISRQLMSAFSQPIYYSKSFNISDCTKRRQYLNLLQTFWEIILESPLVKVLDYMGVLK